MAKRQLDEDDVRVRPGKSSRPRSRLRPAYDDSVPATVVTVDRGRYTCRTDDAVELVAVRGGDVRKTPVVVGDRVDVVGDVSGRVDTLARIVRVQERTSLLRRTPDDTESTEKPVVANAELLVIVMAVAQPAPNTRMIDRCLVAAFDGGLTPALCLTKTDLGSPDEVLARYRALDVPVVSTGRVADHLDPAPVADLVRGRSAVFFGPSGVGKSTLVNALVPGARRATAEVSDLTGKGRHTSTSAIALAFEDGWVIDTPGVRSFGLGGVDVRRVIAAFPDLAEGAEHCLPMCTHTADEPTCRLDAWVADNGSDPERLASLRLVLASLAGTAD